MSFVYLRFYATEKGLMVACCDEAIMGKTFREGKLRISVEKGFYGDSLLGLAEALVLLEGADILNLAGKNIVTAAIQKGLVHPEAVISIDGVAHVQVMRL